MNKSYLNVFSCIFLAVITTNVRAGFDEGKIAYEQGKYAAAITELQPLADAGNADAQVMVGAMLQTGSSLKSGLADSIPLGPKRAISYFIKSADQHNICGAYRAGLAYKDGAGVSQDNATAKKYLKIAADSGEHGECAGRAQWELAKVFYGGLGQSDKNAAIEYAKLADASDVDWSKDKAQGKAVPFSVVAEGTAIDAKEAARQKARELEKQRAKEDEEDDKDVGRSWWDSGGCERAIDQSGCLENYKTQLRLDAALSAFEKHDYAAAFRKYKHQADRSYPDAEVFLGLMLHDGLGIQRDDKKAHAYLASGLERLTLIAWNGYSINSMPFIGIKQKKYYIYASYYLAEYNVSRPNHSLRCYTLAANEGYVPAMLGAAKLLIKAASDGTGGNKAFADARGWLQKAQTSGSDEATAILAQFDSPQQAATAYPENK